eukprot:Sspe_Gene.50457::Locus_28082_Transcript_1_1_Confidence_1.000_Length_363::g.50457::m.50457
MDSLRSLKGREQAWLAAAAGAVFLAVGSTLCSRKSDDDEDALQDAFKSERKVCGNIEVKDKHVKVASHERHDGLNRGTGNAQCEVAERTTCKVEEKAKLEAEKAKREA